MGNIRTGVIDSTVKKGKTDGEIRSECRTEREGVCECGQMYLKLEILSCTRSI